MARVTVEDCVTLVPNRYELVMLASQRARQLASGAPLTLDRDNDKNAVVALREIANQTISLDEMRQAVISNYQTVAEPDVLEEDTETFSLSDDDMVPTPPALEAGEAEDTDEASDPEAALETSAEEGTQDAGDGEDAPEAATDKAPETDDDETSP